MFWGGRFILNHNPFLKEEQRGFAPEWKCGGKGVTVIPLLKKRVVGYI